MPRLAWVVVVAILVFGGCSRNSEPVLSPSATTKVATAVNNGETITVTTLEDYSDFAGVQRVTDLPGPDGQVSFREAVDAANNTPGPQTIAFAVPPASFWLFPEMGMLKLETGPFFLNDDATTIDFSSQTLMGDTNTGGPEIGVYGLEPNGWGTAAIFINGDNCVIKGLGYVSQRGYAVQIVGNQNRVIGCQITGPLLSALCIQGYMGGPTPTGNMIGGTQPGEGNYLTSVKIGGPAEGNIVVGNTVIGGGVEVQGAPQYGVVARNNRIGGPTAAERNVISGAGAYGEEGYPVGAQVTVINADGTTVEGNYIGTTVDGMAVYSPQIGQTGIEVRDSRSTTLRGNLIAGIRVVGTGHYLGKIFGQGILVNAVNYDSQGTMIQGNSIGVAADGMTQLLTRSGIVVSPLSTIHHAFATRVESNHIARIETTGILIAAQENGVTITRNSIHDCGALGIDLVNSAGGTGPTPNDAMDADDGANRLQNFPVLVSASTTGSVVRVQGVLDSSPFDQFTLEFFASPSCDPSGFGEGAMFIGSTVVNTNGPGHASFSFSAYASVPAGSKITATATRSMYYDTSEFSACIAATLDEYRRSGKIVPTKNN